MATYILRRLILMIPTLIGITFLVFMIVALSPGGIGAALRHQGGSAEATSIAAQQAYLEDRYGLNDPAIVQYLRWLGRVSPVKFGQRDQVDTTGAVIRSPRNLEPPAFAGKWYAQGEVPTPPPPPLFQFDPNDDISERASIFRRAENQYARARTAYIAARTDLEEAIGRYARAQGISEPMNRTTRRLDMSRVRGLEFDPNLDEAQAVLQAGERAIEEFRIALQVRAELEGIFNAEPFRKVGLPIIPGILSIGPPDFGFAFSTGRPVIEIISSALPITLTLNLIAFPIIYIIAIPMGMLAATRQGTWIDITSGAFFVALWSIPVVWAGVLAVGYLANVNYLGWFPAAGLSSAEATDYPFLPFQDDAGAWQAGFLMDRFWHLVLPVACLVYTGFAVLSKQTRAAMLDNFNADYVRTAKAKGLPEKTIVFRHVFRNSLLPLITLFATIFPAMLSGSVIVESIFSINGMGKMVIDAINLRDRELLLANVLLIGATNMLALLLADILYALADPRITYD